MSAIKDMNHLEALNVQDNTSISQSQIPEDLRNKVRMKHLSFSSGSALQHNRFFATRAEMCGKRPSMEDAALVISKFAGDDKMDYFAIFDGHGGAMVKLSTYTCAKYRKY